MTNDPIFVRWARDARRLRNDSLYVGLGCGGLAGGYWWVGITVGVVVFVGAALYCVVEAARAHQDVRRYEQDAREARGVKQGGDA